MENIDPKMAIHLLNQAGLLDQAAIFQAKTQAPFEIQRITFDLSTAQLVTQPFKISFPFKSVFVETASDTAAVISLIPNRLDSYQSQVNLTQRDSLNFPKPIGEAYLYWAAQAGKSMTLVFFTSGNFTSGSFNSVSAGGVSVNEGSAWSTTNTSLTAATAKILCAQSFTRKVATIQNNTGASLFVGPTSSVIDTASSANLGFEIPAGGTFYWRNTAVLYGYSVPGGRALIIEET